MCKFSQMHLLPFLLCVVSPCRGVLFPDRWAVDGFSGLSSSISYHSWYWVRMALLIRARICKAKSEKLLGHRVHPWYSVDQTLCSPLSLNHRVTRSRSCCTFSTIGLLAQDPQGHVTLPTGSLPVWDDRNRKEGGWLPLMDSGVFGKKQARYCGAMGALVPCWTKVS